MIKWHLEQRKISELKNWEKNPRTISEKAFKELEKSVDALGNFEPLVINIDGTVIAGNQRLRLEMKKGNNEVDVYVPERELSEEEIKKIGVISNRHSGDWDMDILANEFDDVLKDLGFDDLLPELVMEVSEDDYEEPEQLPSKVQLGEVWQLGKHRLMCGDSTKIEDVERLMNGQKADMVFTDPLYGINVVKNDMVGADFGVADKGKYLPVINDETTQTAQDAYALFVMLDVPKIILWGGNYFLSFLPPSDGWLIWDKRVDTGIKNTFADGEMAWCNFHTPVRIYKQLWNGMIREGEKGKRVHPTQKPVRILGEILKDFTKENEIITDVFGGSGSTLIACEQTDRVCYMMELDTHYCDVIIDRWEKLTGQVATKL